MYHNATDTVRLRTACHTVRADLLAERTVAGHWEGRLASSPLATATAISALLFAHRDNALGGKRLAAARDAFPASDWLVQCDLSDLIVSGLTYLAEHQNTDGGWGDTDRSLSNIATTMLVRAAFQLTGVPSRYAGLAERADKYIADQGGAAAVRRRYGKDKTFAVPILTNCALAGLVPWSKVSVLPFELACIPQRWYHLARLPVVSYAIPALVAIGQAKFYHDPPRNPLSRWLRRAAVGPSLAVLERMQPASGGFLEATPLTSFVVMSLASIGQTDHPVVQRGVEFLLESVREDGSWPIDTNLTTWNTTLAINALARGHNDDAEILTDRCRDWLLDCQHTVQHPYTGAAPGGWAWTDLSGGVPDADDTPGALLALAKFHAAGRSNEALQRAAMLGAGWLLDLQNRDGGWPTFCRGWGTMPFDRSASDLTAHALRALFAWQQIWQRCHSTNPDAKQSALCGRISAAINRGLTFLGAEQREDGSWVPLWFGNQFHAAEENPVYGTAKVLMMYHALGMADSAIARRGAAWLADVQLADGGWGPAICPAKSPAKTKPPTGKGSSEPTPPASIEETALAVEALLPFLDLEIQLEIQRERQPAVHKAVASGLNWLIEVVEGGRHREPVPIGFYFAKLWYYERLYPQIFAASALARACEVLSAVPSRELVLATANLSDS